ncbi:hypothetical protein NN761_11145 [Bacteroides clarus]|uniref:hypothetical protein n=1 Tax=Bacteroides clarus TaxID=626929 RepID=UPI002100C09A|nr:hypothetical protein [Bacteroides clarus]MCQ1546126.1 hypothetical protein [Bacteroides clarus]
MNLNELRDRAYKTACDHGFHDEELSNEHCLCLVISELMEAVEADRKGKRFNKDAKETYELIQNVKFCKVIYENYIKGSVEEELADAVIRLLDLAGLRNFNLNRFSPVNVVLRKKTFTENIYAIVKEIMDSKYSLEEQVNYVITQVFALADILGVDLLWHINQKMRYNELRENKHGKRY